MIQDIFPEKFDRLYSYKTEIKENDYVVIFNNGNAVLKEINNELHIPQSKELKIKDKSKLELLGSSNNQNYFISSYENISEIDTMYTEKDMRYIINNLPKLNRWIISLADELFKWHDNNKFCSRCATPLEKKENERAFSCPNCGNIIYPKISPAVIVGIINKNDEILLVEGKAYQGLFYSIVAGFTEPGETLEETVVREVKEETGITLQLDDIKYYKSQPWALSSSMMIGFFAKYNGDEELIIDQEELVDGKWFSRDELPNIPGDISIAGEMIDLFRENKKLF